jgi:hypothetical protein
MSESKPIIWEESPKFMNPFEGVGKSTVASNFATMLEINSAYLPDPPNFSLNEVDLTCNEKEEDLDFEFVSDPLLDLLFSLNRVLTSAHLSAPVRSVIEEEAKRVTKEILDRTENNMFDNNNNK